MTKKLTAQLNGPGGAYIRSSRWSKSEEMTITYGVNQPEVEVYTNNHSEALSKVRSRIYDLSEAHSWLNGQLARGTKDLIAVLAKIELSHLTIDQFVADHIREIYDQRLLREIDTSLLRAAPATIPVAFNKQKLIETIQEARAIIGRFGLDPVNRLMIAVRHADLIWEIFPDAKPDDDPDVVYPADKVRAPVHTATGGTYGLMMGLKVIVDPEMGPKWELRDRQTGDKIQFVEDPYEPGKFYQFDPALSSWDGGVNDGSQATQHRRDRLGNQADHAGGAGPAD